MLDHTGQRRERYEDTLRALGNYLDQHRYTQVSIVETPQGFLIKGYVLSDRSAAYHVEPVTVLFSNEDLDDLLEEASDRRGRKRT